MKVAVYRNCRGDWCAESYDPLTGVEVTTCKRNSGRVVTCFLGGVAVKETERARVASYSWDAPRQYIDHPQVTRATRAALVAAHSSAMAAAGYEVGA